MFKLDHSHGAGDKMVAMSAPLFYRFRKAKDKSVANVFEKLKKVAAPAILHGSSAALRSPLMGANSKDRLWRFAQRYAAFFDVVTDARLQNGMTCRVSSAPRVEQEIFLFGEWEPLFTRYLQDIPANDDIFLDVGANIGYFSLIASEIFGEVHSIEASPSTARRLQTIIAANDIANINVHEMAVGETEGHIDFFQDKNQSGGASVIQTENSIFEARVPIAPLETILEGIDWGRVRFIKIDVEGLERPVLESIFRLRDQLQPALEIFVEFDPDHRDSWPSVEAFLANGYSAFMVQGPYDRRDYLEPDRRTTLDPVDGKPQVFCDLIIRRQAA